jgi:hypothetical protein
MIGAVGVGGGDENGSIEGLKSTFGERVTPPTSPGVDYQYRQPLF